MWIIPFLQEGLLWRMEDPESHQRPFTRGKPRVTRELGNELVFLFILQACLELRAKIEYRSTGKRLTTDVRVKKPKFTKKKLLKKLLENKSCQ
jgi:hypothetical protein